MALVVMRHGPTAATPATGKTVASAGADLPLEPGARQALDRTVRTLPPVDKIYTSDLQRATETARIWSKQSGAPIEVLPALESWNLGRFRGLHSKAADAVVADLVKHPNKQPPGGGESFHQFLQRLLPVAVPLITDGQLHGMVGHSRSIKALQAFLAAGGKGIDRANWNKEPLLKPAQALLLRAESADQGRAG